MHEQGTNASKIVAKADVHNTEDHEIIKSIDGPIYLPEFDTLGHERTQPTLTGRNYLLILERFTFFWRCRKCRYKLSNELLVAVYFEYESTTILAQVLKLKVLDNYFLSRISSHGTVTCCVVE